MDKKSQGFITIVSGIIISAIILIVVGVLSSTNFLGRFNTQFFEMKLISKELAKACTEHARLQLASGAYDGNETVNVGSSTCKILTIEDEPNRTIIKVEAETSGKTTNLKLTLNSYNLEIISLEEIKAF